MRALLAIALVGCADPTGLGEASSSEHDSAASATVTVANATDGTRQYRIWRIEIGEAPPGTDCHNRGDALIVFDVFTGLNSAPRGEINFTTDIPPFLFPAVSAQYANGFPIDGLMVIDAASTTGLYGNFRGQANLDDAIVTVDAEFEAPTCGV